MTNQPEDSPGSSKKKHWEGVYADKKSTEVSWYQQHPERSLALIKATGIDDTAHIIDIGAGASTLVDFLLDAGYQNLTVLDIAQGAIKQAQSRLGNRANKITWLEHDILTYAADKPFDVWHDRAVFHFLTDTVDQSNYVRTMFEALKPGAHAIMATFDLSGPEKCSGLEIVRYSPETLSAVLGDSFQLIETSTEQHMTPNDTSQNYVYCRFKRV